jgi:hypothetical protein
MKTLFNNKSLIIRKMFLVLIVLMVSQTGCKKEMDIAAPEGDAVNVSSMNQLKVAADFNWKTTKDIGVIITSGTRGAVVIKSAEGAIYEKAILLPGESYNSTITIPTFEQEITVVFNGKSQIIKIADGKLTCSL